jgi:ABC-2 type transport system permease protein
MRNTWIIAWKELRGYFGQPMAYVISGTFLFITGFFFVDNLSSPLPEATIRGYSLNQLWVVFLLGIMAPLTMRLIAEEQKLGTMDLLMSNPIRDHEVILGKYLAAAVVFLVMVALSLFYPFLLQFFAEPDTGPMLTGHLGILLLGLLALSVGIFASSLTSNQIVAAVLTLGTLSIMWFIAQGTNFLGGDLADFVAFVALRNHYRDLAVGIIETKSLIYFVSMIALFLFLAIRVLESRRWR